MPVKPYTLCNYNDTQTKPIDSDSSTDDSISDLKLYMLELVNDERTFVGLEPVKLGKNKAAQYHANSMLNMHIWAPVC